jgi:alpha-galactosidase
MSLKFSLRSMIPPEMFLSDLKPARATCGWGMVETNRSVSQQPLSIAGKRYRRGIGTHAESELAYELYGLFDSLTATVGVDDGNGVDKGTVEFIVAGDGKTLWQSGPTTKADGPKRIEARVAGVKQLVLRVTAAGDGIDYDHADWADIRLHRNTE